MALPFDLRQLRYFVEVAESGSFRAAAERLHVSQPPLSRQVAALERTLGARLFDRHAGGVTPTPAGRVALAGARALLAQAQALSRAVAAEVRSGRRFRIGVTAALAVTDRARITRAWRAALAGVAVDVEVGFSRDLIPALKEKHLDFAIVGVPGDLGGLETREVDRSRLVAALPSSHRLARRRRISLLDVTDLPFFWIPRSHNPAYHDFCLRYFRRIGFRPEMIIVEPGLLQTIERIGTGEGWSVPNGASLETRVRGVAYRELVEGEDLAVRLVAAWPGPDDEGRCDRLADVAMRVLRRGLSRTGAGRRA